LPAAKKEIEKTVMECVSEAFFTSKNISNKYLKESNINMCLSRAQNSGMKFAKDALLPDNNLVKSVMSGAKGDYFNIAQVCGIVGQQNIDGARMKCELNHGKRSLPHYHYEEMEENYESRGFISSSFIKGLSPREFFTHARSGRDGIISTVCSTAGSGYNQRKLSKLLEDMKIHYDYTVRDAADNVIQFSYGPGGFDPTMMTKGNLPFDIDRIIARENI
jgi:DNA-directed RNA polymerase subunit A'